jgi:SIR2-like protein
VTNNNSMEKYVYILGAGFSAPLGIPVMKNFLEKAKDQFSRKPDEYKHFAEIFDKINQLHECTYHYDCDIGNIEEILSILLTLDNIRGTNNAGLFRTFIKDVIEYYTPNSSELDIVDDTSVVPKAYKSSPYVQFVSTVFNLEIQTKNTEYPVKRSNSTMGYNIISTLKDIKKLETHSNHSFISLNYDLVLETVIENINQPFGSKHCFCKDEEPDYNMPCLAKIHGCISKSESIIPPTWNKGELSPSTKKAWKLAGTLLQNAHHIIIIGYSLPETDFYIKYLLKSASISNKKNYTNLKSIKVFDKFSSCKDRYAGFIKTFDAENDFFEGDISELFKYLSPKDGLDLIRAAEHSKIMQERPNYAPELERTINQHIDKRIKEQAKSAIYS